MNKMIKFASVVAVTVALAQTLQAGPISGSIGFSGTGVTFNTGTAATATTVTSWIAPTVQGTFGDFHLPAPFGVANNTPVAFAAGNWNFASGPIANFWAVGGFTFNLLSSALISQGGTAGVNGFVAVSGVGVISGNGFTPTTMTWSFTSQDPASAGTPASWTFSASANTVSSVPDGGATVMLLGIALSGAALLRRKLTA